jgi:DNA-binding response OmpR family regulator
MKSKANRNRILIVEDDQVSAEFIANDCSRHGFETVTCSEASQIWSVLSTGVSAVLLDLGLPDRMHPSLGKRQVYSPLNRNDLFKIKMDVLSLLIIGV